MALPTLLRGALRTAALSALQPRTSSVNTALQDFISSQIFFSFSYDVHATFYSGRTLEPNRDTPHFSHQSG